MLLKLSRLLSLFEKNLRDYKRHWGDAFLLVVLPSDNVFYIQRIGELAEIAKFNASLHFLKLQDVFTQIDTYALEFFKEKAIQIMKLFNR